MAKNEEDHVENNAQDTGNSPHISAYLLLTSGPLKTNGVLTSLKCSPVPLDLHPKHTQDSLSESIHMSPMG